MHLYKEVILLLVALASANAKRALLSADIYAALTTIDGGCSGGYRYCNVTNEFEATAYIGCSLLGCRKCPFDTETCTTFRVSWTKSASDTFIFTLRERCECSFEANFTRKHAYCCS